MPRRKKTSDQLSQEQLEQHLRSQVSAALQEHQSVLDEEQKILDAILLLGKTDRFFIFKKEELAKMFQQAYDTGKLHGGKALDSWYQRELLLQQVPHSPPQGSC